MTADGAIFLTKEPVTAADLEPKLAAMIPVDTAAKKNTTVILRVDRALNVQKLVDVLDIGNHLKVKVVMAADAPKG